MAYLREIVIQAHRRHLAWNSKTQRSDTFRSKADKTILPANVTKIERPFHATSRTILRHLLPGAEYILFGLKIPQPGGVTFKLAVDLVHVLSQTTVWSYSLPTLFELRYRKYAMPLVASDYGENGRDFVVAFHGALPDDRSCATIRRRR